MRMFTVFVQDTFKGIDVTSSTSGISTENSFATFEDACFTVTCRTMIRFLLVTNLTVAGVEEFLTRADWYDPLHKKVSVDLIADLSGKIEKIWHVSWRQISLRS